MWYGILYNYVQQGLLCSRVKGNFASALRTWKKGAKYEYTVGNRYLTLRKSKIAKLIYKDKVLVVEYQKKISRKILEKIHSSIGKLPPHTVKHLTTKEIPDQKHPNVYFDASKSTRTRPKRNQTKPLRHLRELIYSDICK